MNNNDDKQECPICITTCKKLVQCAHCHFGCCQRCVQKNLLNTMAEPSCMSCKHVFSRSFLRQEMPKSFLANAFKMHRQNVMKNQHQQDLPWAQELVLFEKRKKIVNQKIFDLRLKIGELQQEKLRLEEGNIREAHFKQLIRERQFRADDIINDKGEYIIDTREILPAPASSVASQPVPRSCSQEDCRGYLTRSGHCGTCDKMTCLDCNQPMGNEEEKGEEHQCQEDDIKSWKLIHDSTRPCPVCHVRIHRISGCNQMWCTQCRTAFNYRSGEIELGPIHNPVYFQWVRQNQYAAEQDGIARNQHVIQEERRCNPDAPPSVASIGRSGRRGEPLEKMYALLRLVHHVDRVEMQRYRNVQRERQEQKFTVMQQYILKQKDEAQMWKRIQEVDKRAAFDDEMLQIWRMFHASGRDVLWQLITDLAMDTKIISELVTFTNQALDNTANTFGFKSRFEINKLELSVMKK